MTAKELFDAGQVRDAEKSLSAYLRDHPRDTTQRTFLFELLCFSGQYDRAEKQLGVLAEGAEKTQLGAVLYYSALHAEKSRHELFRTEKYPTSPVSKSPPGTLNGKPFESIRDADPEIGPRLEVYAAGAYLWISFEHIASVEIPAPKRLRDTLWTPALVLAGPSFKGADLGEVLIPAIYPFSWKDSNESVWLGRSTEWCTDEKEREYPIGQKVFLVDGEEVPLLEIRTLKFASAEEEAIPEDEEPLEDEASA
jgi:type VI secretion system protein ImpE